MDYGKTLYLLLMSAFFGSVLEREHQFHNLLHLDFIVDIPSVQKRQAFIYRII